MSGAPSDLFKRRSTAAPQVNKIRRFSDVDTDSDFGFEVEDEKPTATSAASLSFKTEATERVTKDGARGRSSASKNFEVTSEGSILFESGSDRDPSPPVVSQPAAKAPAPAETTPPQVPKTTASSFQQSQQPQSLADKLFGNIAFKKASLSPAPTEAPAPPSPTPAAQQPAPSVAPQQRSRASPETPPEQKFVKDAKPATEDKSKTSRQKQVSQEQRSTQRAAVAAPPSPPPQLPAAPVAPPQPPQPSQAQRPPPSPPANVLTAAYEDAFVSKDPSYLREAYEDDAADGKSDAGFADTVLPVDRGAQKSLNAPAPAYITPLRAPQEARSTSYLSDGIQHPSPPAMRDPSDELLVRARLRLEEKRRTEAASAVAGRAATPTRRSTNATPSGLLLSGNRGGTSPRGPHYYMPPPSSVEQPGSGYDYRAASVPGSGANVYARPPTRSSVGGDVGGGAPHMVEAKLRRLTQENTRLQDEVTFLSRENQKLRSVAGSADSAESIKMQLTVDMLRKELHSKEVDHQAALREKEADKAALAQQIAELQDQNEGYESTAGQYRTMYEEKVKEMEQLKLQLQRLLQDVSSLERRQESEAQQHQAELTAEKEKVDKLLYLIEDLKKQRQHLHELNQQVQVELIGVNEDKAKLKESLVTAEERLRQSKVVHEQTAQTLQQDISRLKEALSEKDKNHSAQLREEKRISASLQERLTEATSEGREEAERLRRSLETVREDHKKALTEEKDRRFATEEKLKRAEAEFKSAFATFKEDLITEYERKAKRLREEAAAERQARDEVQLAADRVADELERLQESAAYQSDQYHTLAADFAHSEEMRDKADRQCGALSATLNDMMHNDEQQTQRINQLEELVAELQQRLASASEVTTRIGFPSREGSAGSGVPTDQMGLLSSENERLTNECVRLASERDALIDENGRIAEELLKWKNEMRVFVASQIKHQ